MKEGNNCGLGNVQGTLLCSTTQGALLDEATCPINKEVKIYPPTSAGCPK